MKLPRTAYTAPTFALPAISANFFASVVTVADAMSQLLYSIGVFASRVMCVSGRKESNPHNKHLDEHGAYVLVLFTLRKPK